YAVYDKSTGQQEELISGRQFWLNAGISSSTLSNASTLSNLGAFNARIMYDPTSGRWIAAELTGQSTNNSVLIARSDTSDPTGSWQAVSFLGNAGGSDQFVDYTSLGVDRNGVYVTTNNFPSNTQGSGFDSISVFSLPKTDLLQATPTIANLTRVDALPTPYGQTLQPVTNFGPALSSTPLLASFPDVGPQSFLLLSTLTGTTGPGATFSDNPTTINTATYNDPPSAAQPDGTRSISTIDSRISANVYQVGNTIYAVHSTIVGSNAAITWLKIDATTNQVIQEGVLSNPNFDYFQASMGVNANGDIVIGFTRSGLGAGGNLSDYAVVGHTVGGVTTFGTPFLLQASPVDDYHYVNGRWGDYTTTVADPSNPNAFWTFQEYATGSNSWATQITEILVPEPPAIVPAAAALAALGFVVRRRRRGTASRSV
ncbi:MAG TPA: hypothetical protein VHV08_01930, partial [Pirellulales bacterium]|nr:hypothetical protein [Pirellulales bacterium]